MIKDFSLRQTPSKKIIFFYESENVMLHFLGKTGYYCPQRDFFQQGPRSWKPGVAFPICASAADPCIVDVVVESISWKYRPYFREFGERAMKIGNAICILTILVIGMVFMSGCTSQDSTSTAPAATTAPQVMNELVLAPASTPAMQIANETVPVPTPTPAMQTGNDTVPCTTVTPTPKQVVSPSPQIPTSGVWVKVMYSGNFSGSYGTPGVLKFVEEESGDHIYQVVTTDGPVVVNIQKSDGSSAELVVDVYKDGVLRKHAVTALPRGIVEIQTSVSIVTIPATAAPTSSTTTLTTAVALADVDIPGSLSILTGGGLGSEVTVFIAREGSSVGPINTDPYANTLADQNPGYVKVKILPNGESPTVSLVPGNYIAFLPPKTGGGQPEEQIFTINANSNTVISFSAFSYRASSGGGCG
jgi:hypothetical protein